MTRRRQVLAGVRRRRQSAQLRHVALARPLPLRPAEVRAQPSAGTTAGPADEGGGGGGRPLPRRLSATGRRLPDATHRAQHVQRDDDGGERVGGRPRGVCGGRGGGVWVGGVGGGGGWGEGA